MPSGIDVLSMGEGLAFTGINGSVHQIPEIF
jgi:hypothetical protein